MISSIATFFAIQGLNLSVQMLTGVYSSAFKLGLHKSRDLCSVIDQFEDFVGPRNLFWLDSHSPHDADLFSGSSEDDIDQKSEEGFSDLDDVDEVLLMRKRRKPERLEDTDILGYRDWSSSEVSSFVNFCAKRKPVYFTRKLSL